MLPDEGLADGLSQRLLDQIAELESDTHAQRSEGASLVQALTDQLAAGQSETLYSLHTAGAAVRRQAAALEQAVAQLPADLEPTLRARFDALSAELSSTVVQAVTTATIAVTEATGRLERTATSLAAQTESAVTSSVAAAGRLMTAQTEEAVEQIEAATSTAAKDFQAALIEGLATLNETSRASREQIIAAGNTFSADATASAGAVTAVGENVLTKLVAVLDDRDKRDQLLEDRLTARIDRLTKKTETTVAKLIGQLQDETDLIHARESEDRAFATDQLKAIIGQLLAQPRGKLKDLRKSLDEEDRT